jgi:hypothetical protein
MMQDILIIFSSVWWAISAQPKHIPNRPPPQRPSGLEIQRVRSTPALLAYLTAAVPRLCPTTIISEATAMRNHR